MLHCIAGNISNIPVNHEQSGIGSIVVDLRKSQSVHIYHRVRHELGNFTQKDSQIRQGLPSCQPTILAWDQTKVRIKFGSSAWYPSVWQLDAVLPSYKFGCGTHLLPQFTT